MLGMPVATLRVWERRYRLTQAPASPSGQRRYAAGDVQRLLLLKQLTEQGHTIGSLAALDSAQLQQVAATHAQTQAAVASAQALHAGRGRKTAAGVHSPADPRMPAAAPARPWRVAALGPGWGARLQRPALLQRLGPGVQLAGPFASVAQATAALQGVLPDLVLWQQPHLHGGWWAEWQAAAPPAWVAIPQALLYGFAADPVCEALAAAGVALLREPQPDVVLAQWLNSQQGRWQRALQSDTGAPPPQVANVPVPPRRWDDATLADLASRSTAMACECPRHVAELLLQLAHFEAYSASCENRQAADAELHAHLRHTAATARAQFELALERVARHEGLALPAPMAVPLPAPMAATAAPMTAPQAPKPAGFNPATNPSQG